MPQRPPLAPLWMERQERLQLELRELQKTHPHEFIFTKQFLPWSVLEREAEEVGMQIAAGEIVFPPEKPDEPFHVYGTWQDPARYGFDIHNMTGFAELPSVKTHCNMAYRLAPFLGVPANQLYTQELHQYYHTAMWKRYGRKIYALGQETWDLLANTELPDQRAEYLDAPHLSFFLKFPEGALDFAVEGDTVPQPAEGVFVTFNEVAGSPHRSREMSLLCVGRSPRGSDDDNITYAVVGLGPDALICDVQLHGYIERFNELSGAQDISVVLPRVVMGFLLYMQMAHPHLEPVPPAERVPTNAIKNAAKLRKAEQRNARLSRYGYLYVDRPDVEFGYATAEETTRKRRAPSQPFWVRRHPHKYRVGPGRTGMIEKMIGPYIKCDVSPGETTGEARISRVQPAQERDV